MESNACSWCFVVRSNLAIPGYSGRAKSHGLLPLAINVAAQSLFPTHRYAAGPVPVPPPSFPPKKPPARAPRFPGTSATEYPVAATCVRGGRGSDGRSPEFKCPNLVAGLKGYGGCGSGVVLFAQVREDEALEPAQRQGGSCAQGGDGSPDRWSKMADLGSDFQGEENDVDIVDDGSFNVSVWPDEIEERFIMIMEAEVSKGNRTSTTFSKPAWRAIEETLNAQTKRNYTYTQLRNKFNQLRTRQKDFSNLIKEPGIRWNPMNDTVSASDEVWERLYKVYKSAKRFRKKGCPLFNKLCVIYGDTTTSDFNQHLPNSDHLDTDDREDIEGMNSDTSFTEHSGGTGALPAVPIRSQFFIPSSSRRGKRTSLSTVQTSSLCSPGEISKRRSDAIEKKTNTSSPSRSASETGSNLKMLIVESMQALNALEGIDGVAYSKAVERFHEDYMWMELFLQMTEERKKDWVLNIK